MRNNYICALDLGSNKFACCVAKLKRNGSIEKLFLETVPSAGMRRGRILDIQNASNSIDRLLRKIKKKSGINIRCVYINTYGQDVAIRHSYAIMPLAEKRNKLITPFDVRRVIEEARLLGSNLEDEIIQMMPFSYSVDDQKNIPNPLGLYGRKLGVDLFIISVKTSYLQGISRLLNRLGYEIKHLFSSGLATSKILLDKDSLKNGVYVFCDIGADLAEIVIYEDAILQHIETLPLGGDDLTEEISRAFKIPFQLAEEIKISYAYIIELDRIKEDKEVIIKKDDYYKVISQRKICEVINNQARTICSSIKNRLDILLAKHKPISKVFVGGRTVLIDGFLEMMETTLGVPVKIANRPRLAISTRRELDIISSVPQFMNYATCLGILYEAIQSSQRDKTVSSIASRNIILKLIERIRETYQEYF